MRSIETHFLSYKPDRGGQTPIQRHQIGGADGHPEAPDRRGKRPSGDVGSAGQTPIRGAPYRRGQTPIQRHPIGGPSGLARTVGVAPSARH